MYVYSTLVSVADNKFHIHLPGTVPAFHYFFYLKALQSVFFGFGFIFLITPAIKWTVNLSNRKKATNRKRDYANIFFVMIVLICAFIYFPFYQNRADFVLLREQAIAKGNEKDKIEVHDYILQNISDDMVILCEKDPSIFPVMATGRKMVSIAFTFSNPYLDFDRRENDRNNMLLFLKAGEPISAKQLFSEYDVSFVLLSTKELNEYKTFPLMLGQTVFKNAAFTLFRLNK